MWLLIFLCAFISAIESANSQNYPSVFRKCCTKDRSLVKVINFGVSEDQFLCVNSESARRDFNISKFSHLVGFNNKTLYEGIPANCNVIEMIVSNELELKSEDKVCYDKKIAEISNGTLQQNISQTIALMCNEPENKTRKVFEINHIRKCCPEGQAYDPKYHTCRHILEKNTINNLLEWLHVKSDSVYDMDIGLRCGDDDEYAVELVEQQFVISLDGSILDIRGRKGEGRVPSGQWCIDRDFSGPTLVARVCTSNCAQYGAYCLRKCCPIGFHYKPYTCNSHRSKCVPDKGQNLFDLFPYLEDLENNYDDAVDVIGMGINIKCPAGKFGLNKSESRDSHWLTIDRKLVGKTFEYDKFCLETFDWRDCPQNDFEISALGCFFPEVKNWKFAAVTNVLSAIFLFITVLVYCCLPDLQNLHGRTVICHASVMLVAYSCLARVQIAKVGDTVLCTVLGYGIYFGFVAAFFWLNVMCFDIWWTFGSIRSVQMLRKSSSERRRFLWYSFYAWGVTLVLTMVMFLLDIYHVSDVLDANMGRHHCWFGSEHNNKNDWPHYIFFVVPMGIVTSVNLILWMLTARHCSRVKSEVHRFQAGSVGDRAKKRFRIDRAKIHKMIPFFWKFRRFMNLIYSVFTLFHIKLSICCRYLLTGKLWVVMGAGWITELLATLFSEPFWLWWVTDLINQLQGVFIFLLLVFKPKVYYLIKKRLRLAKPGTSSSGRTSSIFLSRTISSDERTTLKASLPNTDAKRT